MNDELFNELVASVREAGAILQEEEEASRTFVIDEPDVAAIREEYGLSLGLPRFSGQVSSAVKSV